MASITLSLARLISVRRRRAPGRGRSAARPARPRGPPAGTAPACPWVNSRWAPHWPTGTTGAPVRAARRATPFLAAIGEKSGLRWWCPPGRSPPPPSCMAATASVRAWWASRVSRYTRICPAPRRIALSTGLRYSSDLARNWTWRPAVSTKVPQAQRVEVGDVVGGDDHRAVTGMLSRPRQSSRTQKRITGGTTTLARV